MFAAQEEYFFQPAGVREQFKYLSGSPAITSFVSLEFAKLSPHPAIEFPRKFEVVGIKERPGQVGQIHERLASRAW